MRGAAEASDRGEPRAYARAVLSWRVPSPPLSTYVRVLWHADGWMPTNGRERHMPDGTAGLIISLTPGVDRDAGGFSILTGPQSAASHLHGARPETLIGAQFVAGGAMPFLRMPVHEVSNQLIALSDVGFPHASILRERLLAASTADERLRLLESGLTDIVLQRARPDVSIAWAVGQIKALPNQRISDIASAVGRSPRSFIERFASGVGLTPKVFARIQRFHVALRRMHADPHADLADIAVAAGYFDQAHFGHDFRSIASMSPTEYLKGRTDHLNHVAVPG